jgi:hypothetical protein
MKKLTYIFSLAAAILITTSCSEDFLDKRPTSFISIEDFKETSAINPEISAATLRGIYNQMVTAYIGGTSSQEDFGHKSFDLMSDLLSSDMAQVTGAYNRFVPFANLLWTTDKSILLPNYTAWRFYYTIIKSANLLIDGNGGNDAVPESDVAKAAMGQAKAIRAFAYFYLTQYYVVEYDPAKEVLPIYTEPGQPAQGKSKMSDVYDLMISDLNDAIGLMATFSRPNKALINADVAKGLLAYVYASMGESSKNVLAMNLANEVINSGAYPLMSADEVTGGFTQLTTPGWMWGFDITDANNLGLVSWHGFMDAYSYSYQAVGNNRGIDINLYNNIDANDIRKQQFGRVTFGSGTYTVGVSPHIPAGKFYNLARKSMGQRPILDDYVYMRVAEMYLLSAELAAVEGNEGAAKTTLKMLLAKRFENAADYAYVDALTGQALIDEIVFQTKIELLAEGKSYLLMKRRKLTNTRGSNHINLKGQSFAHNDPRLTFEIPQRELTDNPNITSGNK